MRTMLVARTFNGLTALNVFIITSTHIQVYLFKQNL